MTAFDKAWAIVKMPRTLEEITHYEAGRCPSCEGTGKQLVTVGSGNTDDSTSFAHARELAGKDTSYHMMECVSCNGTGVPDDEVWGDEGVMELEDFGKSEEKGKFRGYSKNTVSGRAERQGKARAWNKSRKVARGRTRSIYNRQKSRGNVRPKMRRQLGAGGSRKETSR